ncbi:uncharacterized protein LOC113859261 [Abrus precatorius]|uniref:Uncharacterized protein LOC113859261 n=1 Tax=Abrus precatorius TaxID=3816 RepID=A0A8B8KX03_ABRPR|nr:uncharacterized protein LOC113859261 [Abrus precatorius]
MEYTEDIHEWQQIPEISEWNTVVINENYLEVELQEGGQYSSTNDSSPTHHEDSLQIVPTMLIDSEDGTSSTLTASSSSVSEEDEVPAPPPSDWRVRVANEGKKLLKLRLEAVRAKVVRVASKVSNWGMYAGVFWSFKYVTGAAVVAAVFVSLVYVGIRQRRRKSVDHWVYLLREKDEKIGQLLLRIAQLNEVLSSRRKVPVHRIND